MSEVSDQKAMNSEQFNTDEYEGVMPVIQNYNTFTGVSKSMLQAEISGIYGDVLLTDMNKIIRLYDIYERGARFSTEGSQGDYMPAQLKYKQARALVDKQARFMFSKSPEITIDIPTPEAATDAQVDANDNMQSQIQDYVGKVMKANMFNKKLLQAGKDCFIGKRIALIANFNDTSGISIRFIPSLEFVYETDEDDPDVLKKLVTFYTIKDSQQRVEQRIYKKKYELVKVLVTKDNPFGQQCHIIEMTYDGTGTVLETTFDAMSKFQYIPGTVIVNDGLTGDLSGESEIEQLKRYEAWYSRLNNADMDSMRKGMNPTRWAQDMTPDSTKGLSIGPGSFWDLTSADETNPGKVGVLESDMGYSTSLGATLDRIKSTMYESLDMPDTSSAALKGVVSSGKTLQAIYWGLETRCEEKWLVWRPAIEFLVQCLVDGAKLYPEIAKKYIESPIPETPYNVLVDNNYPIPEDEAQEKDTDLAQVTSGTMSRKSFMIKWNGMTPRDADKELQQLAKEKALLEDSAFSPIGGGTNSTPLDKGSTTETTGLPATI